MWARGHSQTDDRSGEKNEGVEFETLGAIRANSPF